MSAPTLPATTGTHHYRVVDSPAGPLLLVGGPRGLARIAFTCDDHDRVLAELTTDAGPPRPDDGGLDEAARQLREYAAGTRREFTLELDLTPVTPFRRRVLDRMREIPYGRTVSYAGLAAAAGNPRAVRAAATACATNPLPVVVPCHRVVRGDGGTGRYRGGEEAKRALLALESGG